MSDASPYTVTGRQHGNRFTYRCPNADWALRKLRDFRDAGYDDIVVTGPDGSVVSEAELAAGLPGGAPVDVDAVREPVLVG